MNATTVNADALDASVAFWLHALGPDANYTLDDDWSVASAGATALVGIRPHNQETVSAELAFSEGFSLAVECCAAVLSEPYGNPRERLKEAIRCTKLEIESSRVDNARFRLNTAPIAESDARV